MMTSKFSCTVVSAVAAVSLLAPNLGHAQSTASLLSSGSASTDSAGGGSAAASNNGITVDSLDRLFPPGGSANYILAAPSESQTGSKIASGSIGQSSQTVGSTTTGPLPQLAIRGAFAAGIPVYKVTLDGVGFGPSASQAFRFERITNPEDLNLPLAKYIFNGPNPPDVFLKISNRPLETGINPRLVEVAGGVDQQYDLAAPIVVWPWPEAGVSGIALRP